MKTRGKPFTKGKSPNPAGRPKGSRARTALALEAILDGEAETVTRKAIEMAKGGDAVALRLVLDRLVPPRRERLIEFALPEVNTAADVVKATGAVLKATSEGEITPSEAAELGKLLAAHVEAIKATDHEERLKAIEEKSRVA